MIKKFTSKRELSRYVPRRVFVIDNWQRFIASKRSGLVVVYGYGMAELFDCVGMSYYLLWRGKSGDLFYSYVTDTQIKLLSE